jgi:sterol 3beta-glucosyltransferase
MRVGMAMVGSRGDIQPFVALAHALVSAGHEVMITANADAAELVAAVAGATFVPFDMDVHAMLSSQEGQWLLASGKTRKFLDFANRTLAAAYDSLGHGVRAAAEGADVVVAGIGIDDYAVAACQALGVPLILGYLAPWLPTAAHPQIMTSRVGLLPRSLGGPGNVLSHRVTEWAYWYGRREHINAFRRSLGLAPSQCSIVTGAARLGTPVLLAYSTAVHPAPPDWHPGSLVTGYWRLPEQARQRIGESRPPPGLADWLDSGDLPVFLGFGSMPILDPAPVIEAAIEAARRARIRILIGAGWSELARAEGTLPEYVRTVGGVDHDWLFPRCRAVIHHGGSGTTSAGLTAGRPTWIYSLFYDQPFWGKQVSRLGVGGHGRFRQMRPGPLAAVVRRLAREDIRQRAGALGDQLSREDGVATAMSAITASVRPGLP